MRSLVLTPLFADVSALDGVGPRLQKLFARLLRGPAPDTPPRVVDVLFHLPTGLIDRRARPKLAEAKAGELATIEVEIEEHRPPKGRRGPHRVVATDGTGYLELVFFHGDERYLKRQLPVGAKRIVSGRLAMFDMRLQMPHPDFVVAVDKAGDIPDIEPVYPMTAGLAPKVLASTIAQSLARIGDLPEWLDPAWVERQNWPPFRDAMCTAHHPDSEAALDDTTPARQRLAYDELLANQLALALLRARLRKARGRAFPQAGVLRETLRAALPFTLTGAQRSALAEIDADMGEPLRMLRLVQGDVGSGKTVVALLAMARVIEAGAQAALMAPTELLARQHFKTLTTLAEGSGLRIGLLTGRDKAAVRRETGEAIAAGALDIVVGTHALFQADVTFNDLGLVVVDEQHRFGVHQRLALQAKGAGAGADMLVMTATPIPRTLLLTHYGDMDASRIAEKPPGRQPIATAAVPVERIGEITAAIERAIKGGARVYWVCPLVEESETSDAVAAEARFEMLEKHFPGQVALVHGRLGADEKTRAMQAFADGDKAILVATTVIEVGVDVTEATVMVIEHAERFGLAQLHQLRGRVGRGDKPSSCLLLYRGPLTETARARLQVMRETEDGFVIAEKDLELRGGGEVLGTRQSGLPEFRLARFPAHTDLLRAARDDAGLILNRDPALEADRGQALKTLLYLFERDEALRLLKAG